ncbi:hypothetical protein GobsT_50770 [Gemmata obscuriglobus]|uniref:Cadherin domain-containing protein n=1 Tax=Gemmata obscuriglobus TaxID=114 RepID=A0A2Z3GWN6_9BACT|nr:cadherin repeat domain-containing protein [Gemmata obscuriglobus]AWM37021.1 hypothetical protein C1280_08310 [Gemmata obscuriglobus]QEG30273.1 hypothetical protein GobsT_50770 [Gemmata obscuriglobus]VTS09597.1 hemolysin-type calcium-binding region protein : Uncharacterized protein OS=Loktanella hongkongensis DSM 17492 GN=Lokhon_00117 PE=4 SV=1 [Gemmata obscuriglobus UQM 2246]
MRRRSVILNRTAAAVAPDAPGAFRVPMITAWYTGKTVPAPQSYHDAVAVDAADANTHPHMGPFTHNTVKNGNWSDPTLWDTGTVPGANAVCNVAHDVSYDLESDVKIKDIHVGGAARFRFVAHKDTRLWVDTLMNHGIQSLPDGVGFIPESATPGKPRCEVVFWQSEAPGATTRLGINTMGPCRIAGADKTPRLWCPVTIAAGATSATVPGLSRAKWRVGDTIVIGATTDAGVSSTDSQYAGPTQFFGPFNGTDAVRTRTSGYQLSRDEPVTITAIVGDVLYWDAATGYDHPVYADTLPHGQTVTHKVPVINLSRSVRFRSEDPSTLQTRAHAMFMFSDDVDVRNVECLNMGRTDTDPSLARPDGTLAYATDGGALVTNVNNVRGRYPLHVHGTGPYFARKQTVLKGCTVWAPKDAPPTPGWAITHHNSRAAVEGCNVYNVRGAGIVSELGNEIGQWIGCTVMWARGDGFPASWGSRAELWQNHNGHAGIGFESQARQVLQRDNVATSCHSAWFFMQQDTNHLARIADLYSLRLHDPLTQGYGLFGGISPLTRGTYGVEQPQIPDFDDNVAYGCGNLFTVSHRQFTDRTDNTPMISKRCHAVNCRRAINLINYSFNYSFYDFVYRGAAGATAAAALGNVAWAFSFVNGVIRDFPTGILSNGIGFNLNGVYVDISTTNVTTPASDFAADFDTTAWQAANPGKDFATQSAFAGLEGPWVTDPVSVPGVRWKGVLRKGEILNSATDLPRPYPALPRGFGGTEPAPGTPKPYLWIDPASDLSLTPTTTVTFYGAVVDSVGVRAYPEAFSSESFSPATVNYGRLTRTNTGGATGTELVLRNGCFQADGGWKTRLHIVDHDRLTGEYLIAPVDVTLTGFDGQFLLDNAGTPVAPALPLAPEEIGATAPPLVISTTPPTVVTADTASVAENAVLSVALRADDGQVKWAIAGGADAARFEITKVNGVSSLRWAGNATRDHEAPADADADNVYAVTVRATNPLGFASTKTISVTVRDKEEGVVTPFTDTFNRAAEDLEQSPNWLRAGGDAGRLAVAGNALTIATAGAFSAYFSPDTGSTDHYVQAALYGDLALIAVSLTDEQNFVAAGRSGGNVVLRQRAAGVETTLGSWAGVGNSTVRLEYAAGVATVTRNGVTLGTVNVTSGPPATTRAGIVVGTVGPAGTVIDNYAAGAL